METAADRIEQIDLIRSQGQVYRINYSGRRLATLDREMYPTVETYIMADAEERGYCVKYINVFSMSKVSARVEKVQDRGQC